MKRVKSIDKNFCRFLKAKNPFGTLEGGANDGGVIFEFDPNTNTYIKKFDFDEIEFDDAINMQLVKCQTYEAADVRVVVGAGPSFSDPRRGKRKT